MSTEQTIITSDIEDRYFSYHGTGGELFKIFFVNIILTVLTLGLYFPWAKAKILTYHFSNTEFKGSRFAFHGTGKEMFKGFIKAYIILGVLFGAYNWAIILLQQGQAWATAIILAVFAGYCAIIPMAIVGSARYRSSRTTWRGIHFRYTGTVKSMAKVILKGIFFTIITFGIYAAWLIVDIVTELLSNSRLGNVQFKFTGKGGDLFWTQLAGGFLSYITLGIYLFKFQSNIRHFWVNNARMIQGDKKGTLVCSTTGMGFFKLLIGNLLLVIITLGFGAPWAIIRQMKYFAETTLVKGLIDYDNIIQDDVDDANATGEGFFDMLNLEF